MATLSKEPIYIEIGGRRREVRFTLNEAILIRDAGFENQRMLSKITETAEGVEYQAHLETVRAFAWAALSRDAARHNEPWDLDAAGAIVGNGDIFPLVTAVNRALIRFYGGEPEPEGEAPAAPKKVRSGKAGR